MSKIERLEELLADYRGIKNELGEAEERVEYYTGQVAATAERLSETVTELQELGFDVAAFEDADDTINDLIDEEEVEALEQDEKHLKAQPEPQAEPAPAPETDSSALNVCDHIPEGTYVTYSRKVEDGTLVKYRNGDGSTVGEVIIPDVDHFAEATAQIEDQAESGFEVGDSVQHEPSGYSCKILEMRADEALITNGEEANWTPLKDIVRIEDQAESESTEPEGEQTVHIFGDGEVQTFGEVGVFTEEPEESVDEEPVENEPRHLATFSSVSDEPKPVTVIDDTQGVTSYTVRGEEPDDPFKTDRQAFNAET